MSTLAVVEDDVNQLIGQISGLLPLGKVNSKFLKFDF